MKDRNKLPNSFPFDTFIRVDFESHCGVNSVIEENPKKEKKGHKKKSGWRMIIFVLWVHWAIRSNPCSFPTVA